MKHSNLLIDNYHPATARDFIRPFRELTPEGKVLLALRVSNRERKRNLKDQDANLRKAVSKVGSAVVGTFE